MASPHIQFRARPPLADELRARVDDPEHAGLLSYVASESARQLFRLYSAELRDTDLSRDDCVIIIAALLSTVTVIDSSWLDRAPLILSAEIEESDEDDFDAATHSELAKRVRGWPRARALAVIDAVERFKRLPTSTEFDEAVVRVGLLRPEVARAHRDLPPPPSDAAATSRAGPAASLGSDPLDAAGLAVPLP